MLALVDIVYYLSSLSSPVSGNKQPPCMSIRRLESGFVERFEPTVALKLEVERRAGDVASRNERFVPLRKVRIPVSGLLVPFAL